MFDDNRLKIERQPGKKQKENPVGCTRESKIKIGNIKEGAREDKTETV